MITLTKTLLTLSLFITSVVSSANDKVNSSQSSQEKTVLTVAISEVDYFPYNYYENGKLKGFSVDVLDYFEANSNYDFEFIVLPWPRVLLFVALGKVDLVLTLFRTPEREHSYHFIEPAYGNEINQLFKLSDNKLEYSGQLEQLKPYSIGTIREYSYGTEFDQAEYLNKLPALSEAVLVKLLLNKRTDLIVGNPFVFNQIISEQNKTSLVTVIEPPMAITPVYLALTKKRKDSLEINKILGRLTQKLKATPYYTELLNKYELNFK